MAKISVVISAYNEERDIRECLESLKGFADEIVVVDNSSTDATKSIAQKYTKYVFTQKNNPNKIDIQKNFGFSKANNEWILSLDADERMTPELAREIKSVINNLQSTTVAYWIPRKNIIFGKWIQHTGWFPDEQLRLFKKGFAEYTSEHVHEHLSVKGDIGNLGEMFIHEHYKNVKEFILMMMLYAPNEAENVIGKGYKFSYLDAIKFPAREFMSRFFAREGYKDGLHGLVLSLLMAFYHFMIFIFLWEKRDYEDVQDEKILTQLQNVSLSIGKEIKYWFLTESIKKSTGAKKFINRVSRKFFL